ncbi:hypothetical protein Glove_481g113 [Diversispora epigaea]|uniref:Uncharacterized protein n=1 Tax=Diversispora epigaea TaxID=1348612 RepID=A0A397GL10_9GLOM|nr:hypothetical protein Glove_481g113 [Diversispora epigaea]
MEFILLNNTKYIYVSALLNSWRFIAYDNITGLLQSRWFYNYYVKNEQIVSRLIGDLSDKGTHNPEEILHRINSDCSGSCIISLNFRIHGDENDEEVFVIEIPKEKKIARAPLTNNVPSTKINLQMAGGMRMKVMTKISKYYDRDINEDEIHVLRPKGSCLMPRAFHYADRSCHPESTCFSCDLISTYTPID